MAQVTEDVLNALEGTYDAKTKQVHFVTNTVADIKEEEQEVVEKYTTYTVVRGDMLRLIAKKYNSTVKEMFELNKHLIKNPDLIYPGWELIVPER